MKILLSFLQDTGTIPHPIPAYRFWSYYIKNGITEAGMQWLEVPGVDWAEGLIYADHSTEIKSWRDEIWQSTLNYIKAHQADLDIFLCYLHPKQIDVNAINEIIKLGIPCVNFYCDNIREFHKVPDQFKAFSLIWVPEYEAISMYRKADVNFINLPMPMWVDKKYRHVTMSDNSLVSFIGSKDIYREQLLGDVIRQGLAVNIRGSGWFNKNAPIENSSKSIRAKLFNQIAFIKDNGLSGLFIKAIQKTQQPESIYIDPKYILPMPNFDEYISLTQNSAVILGINRVPTFKRSHANPLIYSRLRDIEAPMLGACYITEYCEGLAYLYDLEKDIITYKTTDELLHKTKALLNNKPKQADLRKNAQQRALQEHSIPASLNKLKLKLF